MPSELKNQLLAICYPGDNEINRLGELDVKVGKLFAIATNELLEKAGISAAEVKAIGSHGQTVRHQPIGKYRFTLQIGNPDVIVTETGITTVADFRCRDMAEGGEGAPLAPAFHEYIFRDDAQNRIILNIGGIANITVIPADTTKTVYGFDTGPGNILIDYWSNEHLQKAYDDKGQWAKSGKTNVQLLQKLLADLYFQTAPPKSTGREYFNSKWLATHLEQLPEKCLPQDIQATLLELTAKSIVDAIESCGFAKADIFVCGGGPRNSYLMERLQELAGSNYTLNSTDILGIEPDWVEAMLFAWLAWRTLNKQKYQPWQNHMIQ